MTGMINRKENIMKKLFVSVPMKGRTEEEIKASIQKMKEKSWSLLIAMLKIMHHGRLIRQYGILANHLRSYLRLIFSLELMMIIIGVVVISRE